MRAGLMPRLTRPGVVEGVDGWRVAVLRVGEGETLFDALARALLVAGGDDDPGGFGPALPELRGLGWTEPASLARLLETPAAEVPTRVVAAALDRAAAALAEREGLSEGTGVALLLLLDQLEELFVETVPPEARRTFANLLAALTDTRRIWAVATLRADLYGRLIAERSLIALTDRGAVYALAPPGADEIEEIVRDSAERAGLAFETDPHGGRLDDRLLADASGGDALPLLQFTLSRLFERREAHGDAVRLTFAAYEAIGGVDGAIDQAGRTATEGFGPAEHAALERLFRALIVPIRDERTAAGGRTLALRAAPVDEAAPDATTRGVADGLLRARILQASALEGGGDGAGAAAPVATLRIAHERVLESWSQAREIVTANLRFFALRAEIDGQRQLWEGHGRRPEYLIPPGAPIVEAQAFAHDYADELSPELRAFVAASGWRETRRVRLRRALTGAFATLAVAASLLAAVALYWAGQARAVARTAKGTVTAVVTTFGTELAKLEGIPLRLVGRSLDEVRKLVENLRREIGDDDDLDRGRAAMLHSFASVYQKFSGLATAETTARESLAIRSRLAARAPARGDARGRTRRDARSPRRHPAQAHASRPGRRARPVRPGLRESAAGRPSAGPAGPGRKTRQDLDLGALAKPHPARRRLSRAQAGRRPGARPRNTRPRCA